MKTVLLLSLAVLAPLSAKAELFEPGNSPTFFKNLSGTEMIFNFKNFHLLPPTHSSKRGAATINITAGTIKNIIGNNIFVAAVAPAFSISADLFCLISRDNALRMGPIEAPTESAATRVAENDEI